MNKYILNLYKQFCDARGIIFNPLDINKFLSEFGEWIYNNRKIINKYSSYLLTLGYINEKEVMEVGKGKYDSLNLEGVEVISPYAETLNLENKELFVLEDYPLLKTTDGIRVIKSEVLLTHNPYDEMLIYNWPKIHNAQNYNISIGIYGNIYDNDYSKKIELIEKLSKEMDTDHKVDYEIDNDIYLCSINSTRMVKIKKLVRTR